MAVVRACAHQPKARGDETDAAALGSRPARVESGCDGAKGSPRLNCGEGGIRTRGRLPYARLASGYHRPLGHLSGSLFEPPETTRMLHAVKRFATFVWPVGLGSSRRPSPAGQPPAAPRCERPPTAPAPTRP